MHDGFLGEACLQLMLMHVRPPWWSRPPASRAGVLPVGQSRWLQYSLSQNKILPEIFWHSFPNSWEFLVQILHAHYTFLSTMEYKFLFSYLQLWRSYAILSETIIMCTKCPPSTEMHAVRSHLIWHNFITVGDNWIKFCLLAYIWTFNRRVQFGLKIPNCLGKMSENASVRFGRW